MTQFYSKHFSSWTKSEDITLSDMNQIAMFFFLVGSNLPKPRELAAPTDLHRFFCLSAPNCRSLGTSTSGLDRSSSPFFVFCCCFWSATNCRSLGASTSGLGRSSQLRYSTHPGSQRRVHHGASPGSKDSVDPGFACRGIHHIPDNQIEW